MRLVKICENVWVDPELIRAVTVEGGKVRVWDVRGDDFYVSDLPVEELLAALTALPDVPSPAVEQDAIAAARRNALKDAANYIRILAHGFSLDETVNVTRRHFAEWADVVERLSPSEEA